jgi:hypothetical protein
MVEDIVSKKKEVLSDVTLIALTIENKNNFH